jgi:hypothetical protein
MTSKEELIAKAQALAKEKGTARLGIVEFRRATGHGADLIYRRFGSWRGLCEAAGLQATSWNTRVGDDDIFAAMRDAFVASGGIVTRTAFELKFKFSANVIVRRFRTWHNALVEFEAWAKANEPAFPYFDELAERIAVKPSVTTFGPAPQTGPPWPSCGAKPCGEPIGFRALAHAPVGEIGVVLAFGMLAHELGYSIETVTPSFPDCLAKRRVEGGRWEPVRIEFEHKSRSFREHEHDPAGCDLIVCWEHDWPECPIEVLEIKSAIAELRKEPARVAPGLDTKTSEVLV